MLVENKPITHMTKNNPGIIRNARPQSEVRKSQHHREGSHGTKLQVIPLHPRKGIREAQYYSEPSHKHFARKLAEVSKVIKELPEGNKSIK